MKTPSHVLRAALLAGVAAGCAPPPPPVQVSDWSPGRDARSAIDSPAELARAFSSLDDDDDGKISRFEAVEWPALSAKFHAADLDDSESLDPEEFARIVRRSDFGVL